MHCNSCNKIIDVDSKFCQFCGANLKVAKTDDIKENGVAKEASTLWDKFVEIYDASGDERKKYLDLSSDEVWELIQRISTNSFESFIQENKELLNKQPYRVIETIKNVFGWCASGGYWFWMAEVLFREGELKQPRNIALNHFIEEWKEKISDKYSESLKDLSDELTQAMSTFSEYEVKIVIESAETVKDLPNEVIENLRGALIMQIIWGYLGGVTEKKYRK